MSPYINGRRPSALTKSGRQTEMQNWVCAVCGGRHAYWWHSTEPPSHKDRR